MGKNKFRASAKIAVNWCDVTRCASNRQHMAERERKRVEYQPNEIQLKISHFHTKKIKKRKGKGKSELKVESQPVSVWLKLHQIIKAKNLITAESGKGGSSLGRQWQHVLQVEHP